MTNHFLSMFKSSCYLLLTCTLACNETTNTINRAKEIYAKRDSIEIVNIKSLKENGEHINRAVISLKDSIFKLTADSQLDHRIIGYQKPDLESKRLIIFSVYINDVEKNPFECPLGAYYDLTNTNGLKIKFKEKKDNFIKTIVNDSLGNSTIVYFEKSGVQFPLNKEVIPGQLEEHGFIEMIENFFYRLFYKASVKIDEKVKVGLERVEQSPISDHLSKANDLIDKYKKAIITEERKNKLEDIQIKGKSIFEKHVLGYSTKCEKITGALTIDKKVKQEKSSCHFSIKTIDGKTLKFVSKNDQKLLDSNGQIVTVYYSKTDKESDKKTPNDSVNTTKLPLEK